MAEAVDYNKYKEAVEKLAENRNDFIFNNSTPALASIVMATIIRYAEKEVRIYDDCLNGDIADAHESFLEAVKFALRSGTRIKIVLRHDIGCVHEICKEFRTLQKDYPRLMDIRKANVEFRNDVQRIMGNDVFFIVNDRDAFRMESTEERQQDRKGVCSFNGKEVASNLIEAFDKNHKECEKLNLNVRAAVPA